MKPISRRYPKSNHIVLEGRDSLFTAVPKAACTAIKLAIFEARFPGTKPKLRDLHDKHSGPLIYLGTNRKEITREFSRRRAVAMVRHPYTRAVSGFLNKVAPALDKPTKDLSPFEKPGDDLAIRIAEAFRGMRRQPSSLTEQFVTFLTIIREDVINGKSLNEHWDLQTNILFEDLRSYVFLGKFENFPIDSVEILDALGISGVREISRRSRLHATAASSRLEELVSSEARKLLNEIYQKDFDLLVYRREP